MIDIESVKVEIGQILDLLIERNSGMPPRNQWPGKSLFHDETANAKLICDRLGLLLSMLPKGESICLP